MKYRLTKNYPRVSDSVVAAGISLSSRVGGWNYPCPVGLQ